MEPLYVCGFSGGVASAVMSKLVADQHPGQTVLLYHSTLTEPADNDRFRREVAEYIGLPITEDSDGRDIWRVFADEGLLGNQRMTPCSKILKQMRADAWMAQHPGAVKCLGYTVEEVSRAQRAEGRAAAGGYRVDFPLIRAGLTKNECEHRVENCWGIRIPEMYAWAEHANCVPCVKGGLAYWGMVFLHARQAWEKAAATEEETGHQILSPSKGYGTLAEELPHCLRLAKEYMAKRAAKEVAESLFEYPCECAV